MPAKLLVECPRCKGEGKEPIAEHLLETLIATPSKGSRTAEDIWVLLGRNGTINAQNNRLLDLYLLGLVQRERDGKHWLYSRSKKGTR